MFNYINIEVIFHFSGKTSRRKEKKKKKKKKRGQKE